MKAKMGGFSVFAVMILVIGGMIWSGFTALSGLAQERVQKRRTAALRELSTFFPLMRQRGRPEKLARERLLHVVEDIRVLNKNTCRELLERLYHEFSRDIGIMAFDKDQRLIVYQGFPRNPVSAARNLLATLREGERVTCPDNPVSILTAFAFDYDNMQWGRGMRSNSFPSLSLGRGRDRHNVVACSETYLQGVPGVLLAGFFQCSRREGGGFLWKRDQERRQRGVPFDFGRLLVFVPKKVFRKSAWLARAIKRPIPNILQKSWAGSHDALNRTKRIPEAIRTELKTKSRTERQGFFTGNGFHVGFIRYGPPLDYLGVIWEPIEEKKWGTLELVGCLFVAVCFVFFGIAGAMSWGWLNHIPLNLAVKFLVSAGLLICFPLLGLGWMISSHERWAQEQQIPELFEEMERDLFQQEAYANQMESEAVSNIKVFAEMFPWLNGLPPIEAMKKRFGPATGAQVETLGIVNRKGERLLLDRNMEGAIIVVKPQTNDLGMTFIDALLSMAASQMRLETSSGGGKISTDEVKMQVFLDTLQKLLGGNEALHDLGMRFGRLVTFRVYSEVIWAFLLPLIDPGSGLHTILFFSLNRRSAHYEMVNDWSCELEQTRGTFPHLGWYSLATRAFMPVMPVFFNTHPLFHYLFASLQVDGSVQKLVIEVYGRPMAVLARPFKGFDYVGIAMRPIPRPGETRHPDRTVHGLILFYPLAAIVIVTGFFFVWYLGPVRTLREGVDRLSLGDFDHPLPEASRDEIGELSRSFNRMAEGLKEKEYLSRFLSDLAKSAVKRSDRAPATRVKATVLFSDVRRFTTMSEEHPPEIIVSLLNDHFTKVEEQIEQYHGIIDKFIGDAVMVIFLPLHGKEPPALRAFLAGRTMLETLKSRNLERGTRGELTLEIGVGIATGELLMGGLGRSDGRQDFTVTGITVNVASLMEKRTKETISGMAVCAATKMVLEHSGFGFFRELSSKEGYPSAFEVGDGQ